MFHNISCVLKLLSESVLMCVLNKCFHQGMVHISKVFYPYVAIRILTNSKIIEIHSPLQMKSFNIYKNQQIS